MRERLYFSFRFDLVAINDVHYFAMIVLLVAGLCVWILYRT